jgi:putative heme iron utilization protein
MLEDLLKEILREENVILSVNAGGAIIEMRVNNNLPFRVSQDWITIGDNDAPCHMHINKSDVKEVRFVKEEKRNRTSYSIRLLNAKGERLVGAFFTMMYDDNGHLIKERVDRYDTIFRRYGSRESIPLN